MQRFRYTPGGKWFKGNAHMHSTASDGGKNFAELAEMYRAKNYDFLFRTDHWVLSDVAEDAAEYPLLWLDGTELHGTDDEGTGYHVVALGKVENLQPEMGLVPAMQEARRQGAMLILAHPSWCDNTIAEALRHDFDGVEIYNHVCEWSNGTSNGLAHWRRMMREKPGMLGLAVDDTHLRHEQEFYAGGWIMVNAPELTRENIFAAIKAGNFYASCGPEILNLEYADGKLKVETSPARWIRLCGPGGNGLRVGSQYGGLVTSAEFEMPEWDFFRYVEIVDENNNKAWTNNLFVD